MTLVIAHRGASAYAPENTMPAFELAVAQGADMAELDVQSTADGALIIFHDETTERWNGIQRRIDTCSLADMRALDIQGAKVPTLAEVCAFAREKGLRLNIELKQAGIGAQVVDVVRQERAGDLVLFSSFEAEALAEVAAAAPSLPRAYLMGTQTYQIDVRLRESWPFAALRAYDCAAWHPAYQIPLLQQIIPLVRRAGIQVNVWTVDDPAMMQRLLDLEVDGIITDTPDVLRGIIAERAAKAPSA